MTKEEKLKIISKADDLYSIGRYEDALNMLDLLFPLFSESEKSEEIFGLYLNSMGCALAETRMTGQAIKLFLQALGIAQRFGNKSLEARLLNNLGNAEAYSGNSIGAEKYYRLAIDFAKRENLRWFYVTSLLGYLNERFTLGSNSNQFLEKINEARSLYNDGLLKGIHLYSYLRLESKIAIDRKDDSGTERYLLMAIEVIEKNGLQVSFIIETSYYLSLLWTQQEKHSNALELLEKHYSHALESNHGYLLDITFSLADSSHKTGNYEGAIIYYEKGILLLDNAVAQFDYYQRLFYLEKKSMHFQRYVAFLFNIGDYTRAFEIAEMLQGRLIHDLYFRHNIKRQGDDIIIAASDGRVRLATTAYSEIEKLLLETKCHMLRFFYLNGEESLIAWFIKPGEDPICWNATKSIPLIEEVIDLTRGKYELFTIDEQEINNQNYSLGIFKDISSNVKNNWPGITKKLQNLSKELFPEEILDYLNTHRGKLIIIPHQGLNELPFAALPLSSEIVLICNWEISSTPNAGCYRQLDPRRDYKIAKSLSSQKDITELDNIAPFTLLVGACPPVEFISPLLMKNSSFSLSNDQQSLYLLFSFKELQGARHELETVARLIGDNKTFIGNLATKENVYKYYWQSDVIHFATHGFHHPIEPEASFIVLGFEQDIKNCRLFSSEIKDLMTNAELIVLSACRTGRGYNWHDSNISLSESFLISGARNVISALWPVDDITGIYFMESFYSNMSSGLSVGEAFRMTQEYFFKKNDPIFASFSILGRPDSIIFKKNGDKDEKKEPSASGPGFCGGDLTCWGFRQGEQVNFDSWRFVFINPFESLIYHKSEGMSVQKKASL